MRRKMLVVEDEKFDAINVGQVLKQQFPDTELEVVINGEQALDWIHRFRPSTDERLSLVLMDLTIPRMSGLDLIAEFKAHPYLRHTPIVILSGSENPQAISSAYKSGACGYVVKSDNLADMRGILRKTLDYWLEANRLPPA